MPSSQYPSPKGTDCRLDYNNYIAWLCYSDLQKKKKIAARLASINEYLLNVKLGDGKLMVMVKGLSCSGPIFCQSLCHPQ